MKQKKAILQCNSNLLFNGNIKSIITAQTSRQQSRIITKVLNHISEESIPFTRFFLLSLTDAVTQTGIATA